MRDVVTAVLLQKGKILLVRRGGKVNTFKGKWSCISGGMEGEPLQTALKEIHEETGLSDSDVRLVKMGEPVIAEGEEITFRVHPFLFEVVRGEVRLDWENIEYRWVDPSEVKDYETVPRLAEIVEEVVK